MISGFETSKSSKRKQHRPSNGDICRVRHMKNSRKDGVEAMRTIKFCFLTMVVVCLAASLSHAQPNTILTARDSGVNPKQLKNKPLRPVQSQPGAEIKVSDAVKNADVVDIIVLTDLSVGQPGSGSNNRRLCSLTMRNTGAHAVSNNYTVKYWWRASSLKPWNKYYGCTRQWDIPARSAETFDLDVFIPTGATEFRVTLHDSTENPVIITEISAAVP
jgi:hypothetical protein